MDRYTRVAQLLHWTIAILILINLWLGFAHDSLPRDWQVMPVHKSVGLSVLALTLIRIVWRLTHRAPPVLPTMPRWEKRVANMTYFTFYALMLVMPLTGWIMTSAGDRPLSWFFLFDVPKFNVSKVDPAVGLSGDGHEILGYLFSALIVLHVAAALRHHFVLKDDTLRRMFG